MKEELKYYLLKLPSNMYIEFKLYATGKGITFKQLIINAIQEYMKNGKEIH